MNANVYVDGFNLYYGLKSHARRATTSKDAAYKWLDLAALCRRVLPGDTINRVRYFTAQIQVRGDPWKAQRQHTYLRALQTIPNLTVHYGRFLSSITRMPLAVPSASGPRTVAVLKTEEKGSDVNLAMFLLCDGFAGDYELAVIISNDSDLCLPIEVVRNTLGLQVGILNPHPNTSHALRQVASFYRPIRLGAAIASQLPPTLTDSRGTITKPAGG